MWLGTAIQNGPQDPDGDRARTTIEVLPLNDEPAEAVREISTVDVQVDQDPNLTGMHTVGVSGHFFPRVTVGANPFWSQLASARHNEIVDEQISTSGYAAQLARDGRSGVGKMQYEISLAPELNEAHKLGGDHFLSARSELPDTVAIAGSVGDPFFSAVAQANAKDVSREGYERALYANFLNGVT